MNIYLVGFMGTGKTVVGKYLAKRLKLQFIDLDTIIEAKEKTKIKDIFSRHGEDYFREKEKEAVAEVSKKKNIVVATGGGVVINSENLKRLKESGVVICLFSSPEVIFKRTRTQNQRPLLNIDNPEKEIESLLKKRAGFYARADFNIDTSLKSIEEVAQEIIHILKSVQN